MTERQLNDLRAVVLDYQVLVIAGEREVNELVEGLKANRAKLEALKAFLAFCKELNPLPPRP